MGMDGVESDAKNVVDGIVLNPMKTQFYRDKERINYFENMC